MYKFTYCVIFLFKVIIVMVDFIQRFNIMKYARFANKLLIYNWKSIILFEIFYKFLMLAGFTPLTRFILNFTMGYANIHYIGNDTILSYLLNPIVLLLLFALLLLILYVTFFDMIAIIQALDASYHEKKITFGQMLRTAFVKSIGIFNYRNWKFIIYIILILPATGIIGFGSYVQSLELPGFIRDYAQTSTLLTIGFIFASVVMIFFSFKWAFSVHFYTLENCSYKEAVEKSWSLMKPNIVRTVLNMLARYLRLALFILTSGAIAGIVAFLLLRFKMIYNTDWFLVPSTIIWTIYLVMLTFSLIAVPIAYSILSALYYGYKLEAQTESKYSYSDLIIPRNEYNEPKTVNKLTIIFIIIGLLLLVAWQFLFGSLSNYDISSNKPDIIAHRGDSINAPENSLPAFQASIDEGLGWIELDVHQTSDGVVVVSHDSSLKRLCGVNKNIYDMTYDELMTYDVGSYFSSDYAGLHMATLEEVLELCQNKIHIQIELKPTGHEENFEEKVIKLIQKYNMEDQCVLTSLYSSSLKKCYELAPEIKRIYLMVIAAGDISSIDYVDGYSIEESFATSTIIQKIHDAGKLCYVWTVNSSDDALRLLENNVDGIVTDYPDEIEKEMIAYYGNDPVMSVLSLLNLSSIYVSS